MFCLFCKPSSNTYSRCVDFKSHPFFLTYSPISGTELLVLLYISVLFFKFLWSDDSVNKFSLRREPNPIFIIGFIAIQILKLNLPFVSKVIATFDCYILCHVSLFHRSSQQKNPKRLDIFQQWCPNHCQYFLRSFHNSRYSISEYYFSCDIH